MISGKKEGSSLSFLNRNQSLVVAAILAIMTAVFLPIQVILAVGAGWGTAVAFLLIGGPIFGLMYILWNLTEWVTSDNKETRGTYFAKLILCMVLFWILAAMTHHIGKLGGT